MWSLRGFDLVVSSTDQQQARRHSAEIVKLLVPQGKNEAFRSRRDYRNLRLYECKGLIQISRTSSGGAALLLLPVLLCLSLGSM